MKRYIYLIISAVFLSALAPAQQEYFFYHFKEKVNPKKLDGYFSVKFRQGIPSTTCRKVIERTAGEKVDIVGGIDMHSPDGSMSFVCFLRLKDGYDQKILNSLMEDISKDPLVGQPGMCFSNGDGVRLYTTDEVIVKFKGWVSESGIRDLNSLFKCRVVEKVKGFDNLFLLSNNGSSDNVFELSGRYSVSSMVDFAQPNFIRTGMLLMPNDSLLPYMWHVKNTGTNIPEGVIGIPGCDLNLESAWNVTAGNSQVLVAIVDTGVDTLHPDLIANLCDRRLWYDAYDEDFKPYDEHYHGTGVSGVTVAVGNNVIGSVGVSYMCKLMPVRVFGPGNLGAPTTDLILGKGLNWAWTHGADIINCSWGGGIPSPLISHAIINAKNYGRSGRGTVIFAGSGNDNIDTILYPSSMPEVISVGGLSPCNQRKSTSSCDAVSSNQNWGASYGEGLSVVAPTTFIGTTTLGGGWCICGNGTSVASPAAAGVGALILSKNINLSADSVIMIIERSALKVGNYSYNVVKPNGLWNYEMGYGRIDAKLALDMTPPGPVSIFDQVPPEISFIPTESNVLNTANFFYATITDNQGVATGMNAPRMYYYTTQDPRMNVVTGLLTSPNVYKFGIRIPYSSGIYYYIAAQDTSTNGNIMTYPFGGKGYNPPGTVRPPKLLFLRNAPVYDTSFTGLQVPLIISSINETTVVSALNVLTNRTILDVNCMLNIDHTYDADISVSLTSPSGTEIVLTGGVGGSGDNYVNTYFDDEALTPIDDTTASPPFTGSFKPVEKLWLFDGESSAGEWKLKVVDNGAVDGGVLKSWNMIFKYSSIGDEVQIPDKFSLLTNYPNPFNPATRILFNVPYKARVRIAVYDILGRLVAVLLDEERNAMLEDHVDFNMLDSKVNHGSGIASSVYFYVLIADGVLMDSRKMVLLK